MAVFKNELTVDVSKFVNGIKTALGLSEKLDGKKVDVKANVNTKELDGAVATANKLDGKVVDIKVNADTSELNKATASAAKSGGALGGAIGGALGAVGIGAAIQGITFLGKGLKDGAIAGDELADSLEVAYAQAGVKDLESSVKATTEANLGLANSLGLPVERINELSVAAAGLAGASGQANTDLAKIAVGVEQATGGMVKGEALIKGFARGLNDPEGAAAIENLIKKYPQLAGVLRSTASAAEKQAAVLKELGPTYATLEKQAQGPDAVLQKLKNTMTIAFQDAGAEVFKAITPITDILGKILPPLLKTLGPAIGGIITSIAPLLASLATQLAPIIKLFADTLIPVIQNLVSGIMPIVQAVFPALITVLSAVGPVIATVAKVVGVLLQALAIGLAPILKVVANVIGRVVTALSPLIDALGDVLPPIIEAILTPVGQLLKAFEPIIPVLVDLLVPVINVLARVLGVVLVSAVNILLVPIKILTAIIEGIVWIVQEGVKWFSGLFDSFVKGVSSVGFLADAFTYIGEKIQLLIGSLPDWIKDMLGLNDANAQAAQSTKDAADETAALTDEQKKLNAENAKGAKVKAKGDGKAKTALQIAQEELKAAIAQRAQKFLELQDTNKRLVAQGKLTAQAAQALELSQRLADSEANRLDTINKLKLKTNDAGAVIGTTLKLQKDESISSLKDQLQEVSNTLRADETAVIIFDADVDRKKVDDQITKTVESANRIVAAEFFKFDDTVIDRFVKKGVDGIDQFNTTVAARVKGLDTELANLSALAQKQQGEEQKKTLELITKLEGDRVGIVNSAANAEKKIRDGVIGKMQEQQGVATGLMKILASFRIDVQTDDSDKALEETKKRIDDVNQSFKDGKITYQSALDSLKDAGTETKGIFQKVGEAISASFKAMADGASAAARATIDGFTASLVAVDALKQAQADGATKTAEGEDIAVAIGKAEAERNAKRKQGYIDLQVSAGAALGAMITNTEQAGDILKKFAIDQASGLLDLYLAPLIASALAVLGPFALPVALGLTQLAKSIMSSAISGFKDGGFTGRGNPNDAAGIVHKEEFVAPKWMTQEHRALLEHLYAKKPLESFPGLMPAFDMAGIGRERPIPMPMQPVNFDSGRHDQRRNEAIQSKMMKEMQGIRKRLDAIPDHSLTEMALSVDMRPIPGWESKRARRAALRKMGR